MKVGITSYSFQYDISGGRETQLSIIEKAKNMGCDFIEFIDLSPHDGSTEIEYAGKLRAEADRVGIEIASYTVGADLYNTDIDEEIERIKKKVDVAEVMGAKVFRHDVMFGYNTPREYRGFMNSLPRYADACRRITEYAAEKGIRTMSENHGLICQDSDKMEALVNTVAHPNYGLLVDIGNFLCADENPVTAVGRVAPYAFHVHVKDFILKSGNEYANTEGFFKTRGGNYLRGTVAGQGVVPVRQCLNTLKAVGYDGNVSLEFEGKERLDFALPAGINFLKKCIETLD